MWYTKNLRIAQTANIDLTQDYETLQQAIPDAKAYAITPSTNNLFIKIGNDDKITDDEFEGSLSEIIKKVLASKFKGMVKNPSPTQRYNPSIANTQTPTQKQTDTTKALRKELIGPGGKGYAQTGPKESQEKPVLLNTDKEQQDALEKISNYFIKENPGKFIFQIPGTLLFLTYNNDKLTPFLSRAQWTDVVNSLYNPVYKQEGHTLSTKFYIETKGIDNLKKNTPHKTKDPFINKIIEDEINKFFGSLEYVLDVATSQSTDYAPQLVSEEPIEISLKDERIRIYLQTFNNYKKTMLPIQVESAIYTYSDNLPVDIYLNGNIIRKNFPNRTYLVLDPEIITFPNAGPHTLIAVDNRNLGSKTTQSKTQTFQFRVEADKELIVFNVQPNRPFIR